MKITAGKCGCTLAVETVMSDIGDQHLTRFDQGFQARSNIDAVPMFIVSPKGEVTQMDADTLRYDFQRPQTFLYFNSAGDSIRNICELDDPAIAQSLEDQAAMCSHSGFEQSCHEIHPTLSRFEPRLHLAVANNPLHQRP